MEINKEPISLSTDNLLAAFQRAQTDFVLVEQTNAFDAIQLSPTREDSATTRTTRFQARIKATPIRFKSLSKDISEQTRKQNEETASSSKFTPSFLKSEGISMDFRERLATSTSFSSSMAQFPQFPWVISITQAVLPKKIADRFNLVNGKVKFSNQPDQIIRASDLVQHGATNYVLKEVSNWHRSAIIKFAATMYIMMHQGNSSLSETQVALFANSLLAQAFGFFCGPDKKLHSPVEVAKEFADVHPDGVMGFFGIKTINKDETSIVSMLPNSEDLCACLQYLTNLKFYLGTNEVLLPMCVAEYKGSENLNDLAKLAYEMDRLRQIHELVWKEPPKIYYGIYVDGFTWNIRALRAEDKNVGNVWTKTINTIEDAVFVAIVLYRFAAFLLDSLTRLKPDYDKLKSLILKLAKEKQATDSELQETEANLKDIGDSKEDKSDSSDNSSTSESSAPSTQDSLPIQKLFDALVASGFSGIQLLKEHGEAKIFECRKGSGLGAIKIGPWSRIEKEALALKQLRGPGVEVLHMSGQIENSTFGYMILERLYPLPKCIGSVKDLQGITIGIMESLARIHNKNYLHRDVKPSNLMMDKNKNVKLIDFEFAMHEDAEKFDIFFGTNFYKPPELSEMYCFSYEDMRRAKQYGSTKSDSYSAALVCASLMYNVELNTEDDIKMIINWLDEGKLSHVATPSAVELFKWLLKQDPAVRFSASQALQHPFLTEQIESDVPKKLASPRKAVSKTVLLPKKQVEVSANKENCVPNAGVVPL